MTSMKSISLFDLSAPQVKKNLINVSYHIAQYTNIISDLHCEIQRLKKKIADQAGPQLLTDRADIRNVQGNSFFFFFSSSFCFFLCFFSSSTSSPSASSSFSSSPPPPPPPPLLLL